MDPIFRTDRLWARPYEKNDAKALHRILSDPVTMAFWPAAYTLEETERWIGWALDHYAAHGVGRYPVFLNETDEMIGDVGFFTLELDGVEVCDLGYILHASHWGRGYALEAARAVCGYAHRAAGITEVAVHMALDHHRSRRVAEKLGARHVKDFDNPRNRGIRSSLFRLDLS
ncbi:MAG: GNAT family N-acetyltransferase [Fimbriimonadaceae bacterium]|nr:GNAT family N-acetyltransferase [Fimbriimonadaceae bacterium]